MNSFFRSACVRGCNSRMLSRSVMYSIYEILSSHWTQVVAALWSKLADELQIYCWIWRNSTANTHVSSTGLLQNLCWDISSSSSSEKVLRHGFIPLFQEAHFAILLPKCSPELVGSLDLLFRILLSIESIRVCYLALSGALRVVVCTTLKSWRSGTLC